MHLICHKLTREIKAKVQIASHLVKAHVFKRFVLATFYKSLQKFMTTVPHHMLDSSLNITKIYLTTWPRCTRLFRRKQLATINVCKVMSILPVRFHFDWKDQLVAVKAKLNHNTTCWLWNWFKKFYFVYGSSNGSEFHLIMIFISISLFCYTDFFYFWKLTHFYSQMVYPGKNTAISFKNTGISLKKYRSIFEEIPEYP